MNPALPTKDQILEALMPIQDPEIRIGIVDLGLIYKVEISSEGDVAIDMTLTAMGCPYGETLAAQVREVAQKLDGVTTVKVARSGKVNCGKLEQANARRAPATTTIVHRFIRLSLATFRCE